MYGFVCALTLVIWHMVSLTSFGIPYLYPIVPFEFEGLKDTFIRSPFSVLNKRLKLLVPKNRKRM